MVSCDPADDAKYYRERPTVVFEVLSPDTGRSDQREKRYAYALILALKVYCIVSQERPEVTILRRAPAGSWVTEVVAGRGSLLRLPEIKVAIPLARIYERTAASRRRPNGTAT